MIYKQCSSTGTENRRAWPEKEIPTSRGREIKSFLNFKNFKIRRITALTKSWDVCGKCGF
jgi:hypothetical protein